MVDDVEVMDTAPEVVQQEQEATQEQQVAQQNNQEALNWARGRESIKRLERERDEARAQLDRFERERSAKQDAPIEEIAISDDEIAEGKHLKVIYKKMKMLEEQNRAYQKQTSVSTAEIKLQTRYPDFNQVVNADTIRALTEQDPEAAETLGALNGNVYLQGATAYKMIKNSIPEAASYAQNRERAQFNSSKPKTVTSIAPQRGDSPLSGANAFSNGLTKELKSQLWKEMDESSRRS